MLLLGIDIGTSSIKVSVLDANTCATVASAQYPEDTETPVTALHPGCSERFGWTPPSPVFARGCTPQRKLFRAERLETLS